MSTTTDETRLPADYGSFQASPVKLIFLVASILFAPTLIMLMVAIFIVRLVMYIVFSSRDNRAQAIKFLPGPLIIIDIVLNDALAGLEQWWEGPVCHFFGWHEEITHESPSL